MENRKDQRIKIQFTEQQKEVLHQRTQQQRFQTINEHIRHRLFVEPELKEMMNGHMTQLHFLFTKILEEVKKHE